ncbi:hypothetical protein QFC19_006816 [Naganishia cerealis]|uniref:Uncharacterized protein n=1 Tax=Naganishia cerealis TaxID=610337 RepID=A0ACC2VDY9_9TREE|nr:hypothetical protein QFC19_006816 [Naganishia cerealis]
MSDSVQTMPSIADASTNEEDYFFTSLGLDDEDGSDGDEQDRNGIAGMKRSDDLLQPRNREDRMRAAYEESKRNYRESLNTLLGKIETDKTPPPAVSPSSENEKILKNRVDKLSREMFDTAMRTCVKLNDVKWAGYVADASQKYWKMPGHAGLAESASRAYHTAERYNDRGALYAYLVAAQQTLQVHTSSTTPSGAQHPQDPSLDVSAAFSRFLDLIEWVIDSVPANYAEPLFSELPEISGDDKAEISRPPRPQRSPPPSVTTSESYIRFGEELAGALMLTEKDLEISRKAWKKLGQLISLRLKAGNTDSSEADEGETTNMGRSVRSL